MFQNMEKKQTLQWLKNYVTYILYTLQFLKTYNVKNWKGVKTGVFTKLLKTQTFCFNKPIKEKLPSL